MTLTAGTMLGPYEILAPIGAGGMGEVYRARDRRLERDVAIKVLSKRLEQDATAIVRFEREARAVAALSHPNIVAIHDFAIEDGLPYTVSELLEGESLRARIERGPLPWRESAQIGIAVADGLSAAHALGIVHRDLKPENLFATRDGRVKILDFGLARPVGELWSAARLDPVAPTVATPSDAGLVLGTVGYMSPEQARGLPLNVTSDIFSLGCVLFELVTGRRAFHRATATDTLAAVLQAPPGPAGESIRVMPPEFDRLIEHCLEKDPARRFQSARDLVFALQTLLSDSSVGTGVVRARERGGARVRAVAVLPFTNDSGDPELDYLNDGLTESLINSLAQWPRLRVVPRTIVFRYKGRSVEPRVVGVELNAGALVTGRVVVRGDTISVQAELIDVATDAQLWGQRYVKPAADMFAVQEELAGEIAEALRGRLGSRARPRKARHKPAPAAYEQYLRGRHAWNRWTPDGFTKAIAHFEGAITFDPSFAPAWAGLADALGAAGYFGVLPAADAMARAKAAAAHAVRLDDALADGHAAMAVGLLFGEWDFAGAEAAFRRALALNPRYAPAHVYFSLYLASQQRGDEAIAEARLAESLDPVSPLTVMSVAWAYHMTGRLEDSLAQLHRVLDLDPNSLSGHGMMLGTLELMGDYDAALRRADDWLRVMGLPEPSAGRLRHGWDTGGVQGYWQARLALLEDGATCFGPSPMVAADIHVRLGNHQQALDCLDQAFAQRLGGMVFLAVEPVFQPLGDDPRFITLLERIGLGRRGRPRVA